MRRDERVLVTGASGFIGLNLCAALLADGYSIRALYRRPIPPDRLEGLQGPRCDLVRADLTKGGIGEAVAGCDAVIHVAGFVSDWGHYREFKRQNVEATVSLLDAAEKARARKFVYISSAAVHGFGRHVDTTEDCGPYYRLRHAYQLTKREAERAVLARAREGFAVTILRPCNVYGPGDTTTTYIMFEQIRKGIMGYLGGGRSYTCPLYVDDLCRGIVAALERDEANGETILLTDGEKVRWRDYVERMYEVAGVKEKPIRMPAWVASVAAGVSSVAYKALRARKGPGLTLYRVEQASRHYHFSNEKARRLLGFEPKVFYREGLERTYQAFIADREQKPSP